MNLTDDWNKGTLRKGWYVVKFNNKIYPDYYNGYFIQTGDKYGLEVLAPCDYEELQEFKQENERLKEAIRLARDTAYSSSQDCPKCSFVDDLLTKILKKGGETNKIVDLRALLRECTKVLKLYGGGYFEDSMHFVISEEHNDFYANDSLELLKRVNAAIGEEE